MPQPSQDQPAPQTSGDEAVVARVLEALASVNDPEIHRPITELGMVKAIEVAPDGATRVDVYLTVSGCPLRDTITRDVTAAVSPLPGVTSVRVEMDVMSPEQRQALQTRLRGASGPEREIPFAKPESLTRVFAIASGKGGVGKSSVTVNLAAAMAADGMSVGILDADIYGHSVPAMLGIGDSRPTVVDDMILPVTAANGVRVMSIGMLKGSRDQVVAWRGPILDRALVQMLSDVFWGDLDVLLLDLPPGTGDIAISIGQRLPGCEVVVVTTPQEAAAEVAERAGTIAVQLHQRVAGVIENMAYLPCPHCGTEHRLELFGSGGGERVSETLSRRFGVPVPLLGQVPLDVRLREGGDSGEPLVLADPDAPASQVLRDVARSLTRRSRGLAGRSLSLTPAGR